MQPLRRLFLIALLALPLAATASDRGMVADVAAPAASGLSANRGLTVAQSGGKSLNQAIDQVKRQCKDCRIISAVTKRQGNREVHEIKALTPDNRVRTFRIPGRSSSSRG